MLNNGMKDKLDLAAKDLKRIKNRRNKGNKSRKETDYQRIIRDQYQKEKHRQRNQHKLAAKTSISKRIVKRNENSLNSSRSKLPYGLRGKFDEKTLEDKSDNNIMNHASNIQNSYSTFQNAKSESRSNNLISTSSDLFQKKNSKRLSSRFVKKKDQIALTNRLLASKERTENAKKLLKESQD